MEPVRPHAKHWPTTGGAVRRDVAHTRMFHFSSTARPPFLICSLCRRRPAVEAAGRGWAGESGDEVRSRPVRRGARLRRARPLPQRELVVVGFAGGGGSCTGIAAALGRAPDIAINHDAWALAVHAANHPSTLHLSKNIWQVDPHEAVKNRPVGLAWFSPDCKHFSKAKGGRPVKRSIRDLAWVVVLWAKRARPRVIMLENVEEFKDWGPVSADGQPDKARRGETFKRWVRRAAAARLPRRVARARRLRLWRADEAQAALSDRPARRAADRLAGADARAAHGSRRDRRPEAAVADGG